MKFSYDFNARIYCTRVNFYPQKFFEIQYCCLLDQFMVSKQGGIIYSYGCWKCRINMGDYRYLGVNWYKSGYLQGNGSGVNVRVDYPAKN